MAEVKEKLTYSVREAAEALGVSRNHLYRQIDIGDIKVIRIGSRILISKDWVKRKLAGELDNPSTSIIS
jgi:excisionase family DNA binding protein